MPQVEGGPKGLNEILHGAYYAALKEGKDKGTASAIAWAAAKDKYKKHGEEWVTKLYVDLAHLCKYSQDPTFTGDRNFLKGVGKCGVEEYNPHLPMTKEKTEKGAISHTEAYEQVKDQPGVEDPHALAQHIVEEAGGEDKKKVTKAGNPNMGTKPDALGNNPISGFNYDPSAEGAGRTAGGDEAARGDERGSYRKSVDGLRDLQKFTKGGAGSGSWDGPGQPRFAHSSSSSGTNAKSTAEQLKSDLKFPYVNSYASDLGGKDKASVLITISLDPKDEWSNGILENSRYGKFHLDHTGRLEQISGYGIPKVRAKTFKDTNEVVSYLKDKLKVEESSKDEEDIPMRELHPRPEDVHDMGVDKAVSAIKDFLNKIGR